jgi:hypothetical protein
MRKHRRPPDRVSNDIHPDNPEPPSPEPPNRGASAPEPSTLESPTLEAPTPEVFDPAEALQCLYLDLVDIEAIANAANEAVVQLPFQRTARRAACSIGSTPWSPRSPTKPAPRSTEEPR